MLTVEQIREFIEAGQGSEWRKQAETGQRYYDGEHDILKKRIFFVDADGELQEDKTKANTRICHTFFTELVDQEVQHTLSKKNFIRSDDPDLQEELDARFNNNDDFKAELESIVTGCVVKGKENAYFFKNKDNKTEFAWADSLNVVKVRARDTDDHCEYVIRWYVDRVDKDGKEIKRIEVWTENETYFYTQVDDGEISPDTNSKPNPRPHTFYTKGKDSKLYQKGFGFIPFLEMERNRKQTSGLNHIKNIIDDYDEMNCGLSNSIHDTNEALYIVHGFAGDNLDELMQNIKAKKHIGVDENGDVDIKTIDIPVEARRTKMELDEKNIYHFGYGVNMDDLKDASATTNVAIKSAYERLNMKSNKGETQLRKFLRDVLDVVLPEINAERKTDYQQKDIYFDGEREMLTNALENAQVALAEAQTRQTEINTIKSVQTDFDNETIIQLICEQFDIDYNDVKDKLPDPEEDLYAMEQAITEEAPAEEPANPAPAGL